MDAALFQFNLHRAEVGYYQITCTPAGDSRARPDDNFIEVCKHGVVETRLCMECEAE